jgi:hypothetical protein
MTSAAAEVLLPIEREVPVTTMDRDSEIRRHSAHKTPLAYRSRCDAHDDLYFNRTGTSMPGPLFVCKDGDF